MLDLVSVGPCLAVRLEPWNAPAGRYFAAYRTQGGFRSLAGHAVIDEFATLSSPILVGPTAWLGQLYDVGISLGHLRDPEMGLDLGWPPLCIGVDRGENRPPAGWQQEMLTALLQPFVPERPTPPGVGRERGRLRNWQLERVLIGEVDLLVCDAPLLPRQLERLCEASGSAMVVAVSKGNRLERVPSGEVRAVWAQSESDLDRLQGAFRELLT